jgi:hypothetical protein
MLALCQRSSVNLETCVVCCVLCRSTCDVIQVATSSTTSAYTDAFKWVTVQSLQRMMRCLQHNMLDACTHVGPMCTARTESECYITGNFESSMQSIHDCCASALLTPDLCVSHIGNTNRYSARIRDCLLKSSAQYDDRAAIHAACVLELHDVHIRKTCNASTFTSHEPTSSQWGSSFQHAVQVHMEGARPPDAGPVAGAPRGVADRRGEVHRPGGVQAAFG